MYTIPLKDNSREIDFVVLRSLLALAGVTAIFYRAGNFVLINVIVAAVLLTAAASVSYLFAVIRIKKNQLLVAAALLLLVATHAITFSILLIAIGMLSAFVHKKPVVVLSKDGVTLKSSKGTAAYNWDEFENIVLKDNLLTLDYKNNKLQQLELDSSNTLDENQINSFCSSCLNP